MTVIKKVEACVTMVQMEPNNEQLYRQVEAALYATAKQHRLLAGSRGVALARSAVFIARRPPYYLKKAVFLLTHNPSKLLQFIVGRRRLQPLNDATNRDTDYQRWIGQPTQKTAAASTGRTLTQRPLVSLITPVFDPPLSEHNKLIEAVMSQSYANFELLLFNFGSNMKVRQLLDEWATKDSRIIVRHDLPNKGIGANSNLCLESVKGDYVALLDHDDALTPDALSSMVAAINETGADFLYSDKDKIDESDARHDPLFKPDFSYEMLLGGNYLTHLNLIRTSLVRSLGGWDPKTDGAQDWDLFLRIVDSGAKIAHVPKILYHWRTVQGSTANGVGVKPYALAAQRLAVNKHLDRQGNAAEAVQDTSGQTFVRWRRPAVAMTAILHAYYGDVEHLIKLATLCEKDGIDYTVLLEASKLSERDRERLQKRISKAIKQYQPGDFQCAVREVVSATNASSVFYIRDSIGGIDSAIISDISWVDQLSGWLTRNDVVLAGGASHTKDNRVTDIGSFFDPKRRYFARYYFGAGPYDGYNGYIQWIRNFVVVNQSCFCFSASLLGSKLWRVLDIPEHEFAQALGVIAHAKGQRAVYDPLVVVQDEVAFCLQTPLSATLQTALDRHTTLAAGDPYYNPNLDANYENPKPLGVVPQDSTDLSIPHLKFVR